MRTFSTNATGTRILARDPNDNDRICCSGADASLLCPACRGAWDAQQTRTTSLGLPGASSGLRALGPGEYRTSDGYVFYDSWHEDGQGLTTAADTDAPDPWAKPAPPPPADPLDGWARR